MPLSEQEQRLLDEMERHLMRNDADVVSAPSDGRSLSYRNIVYGTILVLLGLGGLIVGVSQQLIVVGVIGFVVMLAGVLLAVTPTRGPGRVRVESEKPATARAGVYADDPRAITSSSPGVKDVKLRSRTSTALRASAVFGRARTTPSSSFFTTSRVASLARSSWR